VEVFRKEQPHKAGQDNNGHEKLRGVIVGVRDKKPMTDTRVDRHNNSHSLKITAIPDVQLEVDHERLPRTAIASF
jgi:hypothetical protein